MSLVRYPIGDSPQVALSAPLGAAERASDAGDSSGRSADHSREDTSDSDNNALGEL